MTNVIDFVIAGQAKSGTTALADFLGQHPEVCICVPKEPAYFATDLHAESDRFHGRQRDFEYRSRQQYQQLFAHCEAGQLRGDASTGYIWSRDAPANIHSANPAARVIVMLREPVSFMHSLHMQYCNETTEDEPDFERALAKEPARRRGEQLPRRARTPSYLYYRERARYSGQLRRWFDTFGREQVLVLTMEEFAADNAAVFARVARFLGIDPAFSPDFRTVHGSTAPRSRRLNALLNTPRPKRLLFALVGARRYEAVRRRVAGLVMRERRRASLPTELERRLRTELSAEVDALSELLGRDMRREWGY